MKDVIILDAKVRDLAEPAQYAFRIVHVENMIDHYDHHCNPSDIIQVIFSHTFPTFAIIHNIYKGIIIAGQVCIHQANMTFSYVLCYISLLLSINMRNPTGRRNAGKI